MRPIKLVMTGFESYCNRTEIDFEKLGKKGLYLISGETGAGKTTIFDAITFALYGSASGENRSESMLRSHFADENTPTEVELLFESNNKLYKVVRNPEYIRKAKKGDGTTKESANASLYFESDKNLLPVTKVKDVTQKIEEILGLPKNQFCRIAMIAQGAFQKLLLANTNEKKIIFRELFKTEKFDKLQNVLLQKNSEAKEEVNELSLSIRQYLNGIECNGDDEVSIEVNKIIEKGIVDDQAIIDLNKLINFEEDILNELKVKISKIEKELNKIQEKVQKAEEKKVIENSILENKNILKSEEEKLESIYQKIKALEVETKKIPIYEKEKTLIEASLPEYDELEKKEESILQSQKEIKSFENQIAKENLLIEALRKKIESQKSELENLKFAGEKKVQLESDKRKFESECEEVKKIYENLISLEKEELNYKDEVKSYEELEKEFLLADNVFKEKRKMYNDEQAGILAKNLKKNSPCPVCGSLEHPSPAKCSLVAPTEQEVEEAEKNSKQLQKKSSDKAKSAAVIKSKIDVLSEQIKKDLEKKIENFSLDEKGLIEKVLQMIEQIKNKIDELNNKITLEVNNVARKEILEKEIPLEEKESNLKINSVEEIKKNIVSLNATVLVEEKNIEQKKKNLKYPSSFEAKTELEKIIQNINLIQEKNEKIEVEKKSAVQNIAVLKDRIINLTENFNKIEDFDYDELILQKEKFESQKESLDQKRDLFNEQRGKNKDNVKAIEEVYPKQIKAKEFYDMISILYKVVAGTISGKEKVSLETYVQMRYLDRITQRANLRFKIMTDGKYELCRRRNFDNNRSPLGLELNVKDFYTGRERFVESLSGGEQFQASLSLALGLADEIQATEGGKKLETMFIDEGFGSLDSETLNKAMKALESLSKGDKLIGIISHVDELENRIQNKIRVTKDLSGKSKIDILIG